LVDAFSAVVRGLGWIVPILVILGIIGFVVYLLVKAATRKRRQSPPDSGSAEPKDTGSKTS
jgi:large-conductance mechanosensitive channel